MNKKVTSDNGIKVPSANLVWQWKNPSMSIHLIDGYPICDYIYTHIMS